MPQFAPPKVSSVRGAYFQFEDESPSPKRPSHFAATDIRYVELVEAGIKNWLLLRSEFSQVVYGQSRIVDGRSLDYFLFFGWTNWQAKRIS
jgi:hypothetical protein